MVVVVLVAFELVWLASHEDAMCYVDRLPGDVSNGDRREYIFDGRSEIAQLIL